MSATSEANFLLRPKFIVPALMAAGFTVTTSGSGPYTHAYVLYDALTGENDAAQMAIADREVERLITDKAASLPIPQEVTDVSNE